MSDLVKTVQFGDITFGAPAEIELLHTPWGYYKLLGITKDATTEEIKTAYKKLAQKTHPDKGGSESAFKTLNHVVDILLDDGGELGPKHSRRRHYDEVSSLDSYFDEFIDYSKDRTKKLSEIMLINLEISKKHAEAESQIAKQFPNFAKLKAQLESEDLTDKMKEKIAKEMEDIAAKVAGLTPEMKEHVDESIKEMESRFAAKQKEFLHSFSNSPEVYRAKVLDIFYCGTGKVTFGANRQRIQFGMAGHEDREHILEMILAGDCYISGFRKIHFKAPQADVTLYDPNLEGIFHVVKGNVKLEYESSTYGSVIRARAPQPISFRGFTQKRDLYVPERFATKNWWQRKPVVDIAVREGTINLRLFSPDLNTGFDSLMLLKGKYFGNELYSNFINMYNSISTKKIKKI